ncbi:MAG: hypothetical protein IPK82_21600 [Polyangiaceae bacterium]|nr:hypothetical protein [Polyangiaceae bacterium]
MSPPERPSDSTLSDAAQANPAQLRLCGVTLAQLAGVHAGRAAGVELELVFRNEAVDPSQFEKADEAWQDHIADDESDRLQDAFDGLLADARQRYARPLPPIDSNLDAWIYFLRRFSLEENPTAWLRELGMGVTDVFQLQGFWSARLQDEPELQRRASDLFASEPTEFQPPQPGKAAILPPPAPTGLPVDLPYQANEEDDNENEDDDDDDVDELHAEEQAVFFAPLPAAVAPVRAVQPPRPPPAKVESTPALPIPSTPAEPTIREVPSYVRAAAEAAKAPAPQPAGSPLPTAVVMPVVNIAPAALNSTADISPDIIAKINRALLPFAPTPGAAKSSGSTSPTPVKSSGSTPAAQSSPSASTQVAVGVKSSPSDSESTVEAQPSPIKSSLPFTSSAPAARASPPRPPPKPPAPPKKPPADEPQESTLDAQPSPLRPVVPFKGAPQKPSNLGETTLDAQPSPLKRVVPFQKQAAPAAPTPAAPTTPPAAAAAATPAAPPTPAANTPELTLEQYASLCAELLVFKGRGDAVFAKYGLADLKKRLTVDLTWQEKLRRNPELNARWQQLYKHYTAHWTAQVQGKG